MIILIIIILAYILNISLARWLNKILIKLDHSYDIYAIFWFVPVIPIFSLGILIISNDNIQRNWFTGKYWIIIILSTISLTSCENNIYDNKYIINGCYKNYNDIYKYKYYIKQGSESSASFYSNKLHSIGDTITIN